MYSSWEPENSGIGIGILDSSYSYKYRPMNMRHNNLAK